MKKLFSGIFALAVLLGLAGPVPAGLAVDLRQITFSNGLLSADAEQFPGLGNTWRITLSKADYFQPGDWVDFAIVDSAGRELDSDSEYISSYSLAQSSIVFSLSIYKLTQADVTAGLRAKVEIDPGDYKKPSYTIEMMLPSQLFPTAPGNDADFVKFSEKTTVFEKKQSCAYQAVSLEVLDPYSAVASVRVELRNSYGEELAYDDVWIDRQLGIDFASLYLCPDDFESSPGAQQLVLKVTWSDSAKKPFTATSVGFLSIYSAQAAAAVSKLKNFCVKGSTYKSTPSTKCPSGYKLANFKTPTVIQWNALSRNPAGSAKANFQVFACISQFDTVTGVSNFRAYSSRLETDSYYSGVNSYFKGDKKQLLSYSEDDAIVANVTVIGKYSYQTMGGGTAVPYFQIRDIKKVGTC